MIFNHFHCSVLSSLIIKSMATAATNSPQTRLCIGLIFALLNVLNINGQIRPWMPDTWPDDLVFIAKGTGRTIGNIANISVTNPTAEDVILEFPPLFIPSSGQYQSYIIPSTHEASVPAGSTVTLPIVGYCTDISRPPVPSGSAMPPVEEWIGKDPGLFTNTGIDPAKLMEYWGVTKPNDPGDPPRHSSIIFFPVDTSVNSPVVSNHVPVEMITGNGSTHTAVIQQSFWYISVGNDEIPEIKGNNADTILPESGTNLDISEEEKTQINSSKNSTDTTDYVIEQQTVWNYSVHTPRDSAMISIPLYFDAIEKIIETTDSLTSNGLINTPFSNNPEKEREAVIQQTFWYYTGALHDKPYTKEDFSIKLKEQFEEATGQSVSSAPTQVQEQLQKGVEDFWNTFQLVGTQAKVLQQPPSNSDVNSLPQKKELEEIFGKNDIGDIKIHDKSSADKASETVGAEAFEPGNSIPIAGSPSKDAAAHELVHSKQNNQPNQQPTSSQIPVQSQNLPKIEGQKNSGLPGNYPSRPSDVINPKIVNPFDAPDNIFGSGSDSTQVPAPKENCLCQSLHFRLMIERFLDGDGNDTKERRVVLEQRIKSEFQKPGAANQIDIDKILDLELREKEYFVISIFDPEVKCVCQSEGGYGVPCISYDKSRQKNSTAKQGVGVDINKASSGNVKSANKGGGAKSMKFTIVPNDKSEVIVQFDFASFCSSKECASDSQIETSCKESFVIKLSSPKK